MSFDYIPIPSPEDLVDEHVSDIVFQHLDPEDQPSSIEWDAPPSYVTVACGCTIPIYPGDTLWALPGESVGSLIPIAVDPVTHH